jgi:hypothetical protein
MKRDARAALAAADELVRISEARELLFWLAMGRMLRGAAHVLAALELNDRVALAAATTGAVEGMAAYRATGAALDVPTCTAAIAEGLARLDRQSDARATIDAGITEVERSGQRYYLAELLRIRGAIAVGENAPATALEDLRRARGVAVDQAAALLEARAERDVATLTERLNVRADSASQGSWEPRGG